MFQQTSVIITKNYKQKISTLVKYETIQSVKIKINDLLKKIANNI